MSESTVRNHSPASLRPRPTGPRTTSKTQMRQTADCILVFDFADPVLVDAVLNLLADRSHLEAAQTRYWIESTL